MDIVESCTSTAPSHLRNYMLTMASLDNIPRKEKQFVNFASNSLHLRGSNKKTVDEIWSHLRQEREKRIAEKEKQQLAEKEKQQQQEKVVSNTKSEEKELLNNNSDDIPIDAQKVKKITKKTLKKAPNRSMRIKEMRKVLGKEMGLPKSAKKRLKKILLETAKTSKEKIKIDGKIMFLK